MIIRDKKGSKEFAAVPKTSFSKFAFDLDRSEEFRLLSVAEHVEGNVRTEHFARCIFVAEFIDFDFFCLRVEVKFLLSINAQVNTDYRS
jgi:hypothetical protein